jgi:hypothetical protein
LPHPARLDSLTSAGTFLLDYERGVPVARPHGGREARKRKEKNSTSRRLHHVASTMLLQPRHGDHVSHVTATTSRPCQAECTSRVKAAMTDTFVSAMVIWQNIILSSSQLFLLVLWNCWVRGIAAPGAAGLSAQRRHVPFGLKEGRARCTTLRRF